MTARLSIGIDLGTVNSCVAVFRNERVEIIPNEQGKKTTPSYVAFRDAERMIGDAAKNQAAMNPKNTVFDAKRLIGRHFKDSCVQSDMKNWPFDVSNDSGRIKIPVQFKGERKSYYPEEISSMVLRKMREVAEAHLGTPVRDAVITVPAYFNDLQRQATKDAGLVAGLNVMRIINEPTAAAIAYGLDKRGVTSDGINVLVYDLGGGTFDVSILSIRDGNFEVKATAGDTHLGGQDFDGLMVQHFVDEFRRKHGKDISENARSLQRLRSACEEAKRTLSSTMRAPIQLESLFEGLDFDVAITRTKFEELCYELFQSTLKSVEEALSDAKMSKSDIHEVVPVGGSTRIPFIQKLLRDFFGGKELNKQIDPDEAIAAGAAIQAALLSGDESDAMKGVVLVDVTSLSLGIEIHGGAMGTVIKRNSRIPCRQIGTVRTSEDNQTVAAIRVIQGERAETKDNIELGLFKLYDLTPAPRRTIPIEVAFDIDADGILHVSAVERTSGSRSEITIAKVEGGLSANDVERMVAEAAEYYEQDEKVKKRFAARTALDDLCFKLKRKFGANYVKIKEKVSESERDSVLKRVDETLAWLAEKQLLEVEDYDWRRVQLETDCRPILRKA